METVVFRADGCKEIGMGHIYRSVTLAQTMARELGITPVFITKDYPAVRQLLGAGGLTFRCLPSGQSLREESEAVDRILSEIRPALAVLDILEHDSNPAYTEVFHRHARGLVAITDDTYKRTIDAQLVFNANPSQNASWYAGERNKYFVGPKYFIMDSEYSEESRRSVAQPTANVLLTFGGSDHNNLLYKFAPAAAALSRVGLRLTIVAGHPLSDSPELRKEYAAVQNATFSCNVRDFHSLLRQHEFAVTAGGNTLFNRMAAGIPGVTICQLPRQHETASEFERLGANINLGHWQSVSWHRVDADILNVINDEALLARMVEAGRSLVDGNGTARVLSEIGRQFYAKELPDEVVDHSGRK